MLPVRWQEGVWGVQKGAETELGMWPAHSTGNDPGKQGPSPACIQVRVFTDHRPWTSSLGAPCSRKVPVFSTTAKADLSGLHHKEELVTKPPATLSV